MSCHTSVVPKRRLNETNSTVEQRAKRYPVRLQGNTRWRGTKTAYAIVYGKYKEDAPAVYATEKAYKEKA